MNIFSVEIMKQIFKITMNIFGRFIMRIIKGGNDDNYIYIFNLLIKKKILKIKIEIIYVIIND